MQQVGNVEPTQSIKFENVKPFGKEALNFVCPKSHICFLKLDPIYIGAKNEIIF